MIKDEKLLEKYNEIWKKVSKITKKEFDSNPVYDEKYIKTKLKSYNGKIDTNCHDNKILKQGSQCLCLGSQKLHFPNYKDFLDVFVSWSIRNFLVEKCRVPFREI